jgi:hypothetical protein
VLIFILPKEDEGAGGFSIDGDVGYGVRPVKEKQKDNLRSLVQAA